MVTLGLVPKTIYKYPQVHFLSYTHGSERNCSRAKHRGRLKQKWSFLDDYPKIFYWYPRIPLGPWVI